MNKEDITVWVSLAILFGFICLLGYACSNSKPEERYPELSYEFLKEANSFKYDCLEQSMELIDIMDDLLEETDSDYEFSVKELKIMLDDAGYSYHHSKLDSLIYSQL